MTDDKKGPLDDFDWDAALAEWDKKPFEPEVANEKKEKPPLQRPPTGNKPLYRPPMKTMDPAGAQIAAPNAPIAPPKPPVPPPRPAIAKPPVPKPPVPSFGRKGGGLGQLFSRPDMRKPSAEEEDQAIDVLLEDPVARKRLRAEDDDEGVVTSAASVETFDSDIEDRPIVSPDLHAQDGEMFDPFSDPPAQGKDVPTVHPPPMKDLDDVRPPQQTSPAFDDIIPEAAVPSSSPARAATLEVGESSAPESAPRVQSITSEVEDVSEFEAPRLPSVAPIAIASIEDERPAAEWLDVETIASLRDRAVWLEDEARNVVDKIGSAKCLLAVSELRAIVGDVEDALRLADEAKSLAPHLPLVARQLRGLGPREPGAIVESLDDELRRQPAGAANAKLHATIYAAQAALALGDADAATKRYDVAARIAPNDPRIVLVRALRALGKSELTNAALKIGDAPELATLAMAIASVLRARGVDVAGAPDAGAGALDTIGRARAALEKSDVAGAVDRLGELAATQPGADGTEPVLARGARWLGAALASVRAPTRRRAAELLTELVKAGDELAPRALAARAIELGDVESAARAVAVGDAFSPADRVALTALLGVPSERTEHDTSVLMNDASSATLAAATARKEDPQWVERTAGAAESRAAVRVGRLLASGTSDLDSAADAAERAAPAFARALRVESARRGARHDEVVAALAAPTEGAADDASAQRSLAAALIAERAGLAERAAAAYRAALEGDASNEAAARAAAELDASVVLADALRDLSIAVESTDAVRAALLDLEALLRKPFTAEESHAELDALAKIHRLAPHLPFATFLAQRVARRAGDEAAVVHWLRERQKAASDPLERTLDLVREAWLVADTNSALASERLEEAHRARPDDVALRELHERMAAEPLTDRATWREARAQNATGLAKQLLFIEAAYEHERNGDSAAALVAARAADDGGKGSRLARITLERAELLAGEAARLADELLASARTAGSEPERREAYERLADLDATARNDPGSALLWHRSILEENPRHMPSLRYVEHALLGERRDDELEGVLVSIARTLDGKGSECTAHVEVATRFHTRVGDWDGTREYAELGAKQPKPATWALRLRNAHARAAGDDAAVLDSTLALLERATRPIEIATLSVRAAEAAMRAGDLERAESLADRATTTDAADVAAWKLLALVRTKRGDHARAGEAYESLARTSQTNEHRAAAWYAAGCAFADAEGEKKDDARAIAAFEQVAAIDVTYKDLFQRLSKLYAQKGARAELASLLERRISTVLDPEERVTLEVDRGKALAEAGDFGTAKEAYDAALAVQPDHVVALEAMGELCFKQKDWEGAEQVWVRLARLLATPEEQLAAYRRLGDLYADQLTNLSRAEVALREVLKRAPDDVEARERLVEVYKKQNDAPHALEIQQELLTNAHDPETKRKRLVELSSIHETASHDLRKAEQTLEAARREFPTDVAVLRALAEFYIRHKQTPAVNILLDRAAGDARRAFANGRFSVPLFETMVAVYELRGKQDAARVVSATLAAFSGSDKPDAPKLSGAEGRAFDPRLDDLLAPEMVTPAARSLLARTGQALDAATALDPRALKATPMAQDHAIARLASGMAQAANLAASMPVFTSAQLGKQCVASGDAKQPALLIGEGFVDLPEMPRVFLMIRAFKLMQVRGSAFGRIASAEVPVLIAAWLRAFAPSYAPPGVPPQALAEATKRLQSALPRQVEPDVGLAALEVASAVGPQLGLLGASVVAWANHAALLGIGDLGAALDGVAYGAGPRGDAPPADKPNWIARTPEAKDLVAFSVSDGYTEARSRLGLR
jgi:tetratricopeptide (TPR) repeat protein